MNNFYGTTSSQTEFLVKIGYNEAKVTASNLNGLRNELKKEYEYTYGL